MKAISLSKTVFVLLIITSVRPAIAQSETQNPANGGGVFWKLQGNTGTNTLTHFLGTTDAKDLVIKTQGDEKMRIANSTGYVGIGITPPYEKLHVFGNVRIENDNAFMSSNGGSSSVPMLKLSGTEMYVGDYGNSYYNATHIISGQSPIGYVSIDNSSGTSMIYANNNSGRVGIGTSSPFEKLQVEGNVLVPNSNAYMSSNGFNTSVPLLKLNGTDMYLGDYSNSDYYATHIVCGQAPIGYVSIENSSGASMIYVRNNDQRVGIGTTSPSERLHVEGSIIVPNDYGLKSFDASASNSISLIKLFGTDLYVGEISNSSYYSTHIVSGQSPLGYVSIDNSSGTSMIYARNNDRNVGIGTTTPYDKLHVEGNVLIPNTYSYTSFNSSGTNPVSLLNLGGTSMFIGSYSNNDYDNTHIISGSAPIAYVSIDNASGSSMIYARNNDSYVGIGTSSPTSRLHNAGSFALPVRTTTTSTSLTGGDYSVIFTGSTASQTITIPAASSSEGRVYSIVNHGTVVLTISSVTTGSASTITTMTAGTAIQIISDGSVWRKIN